MSEYTDMAAKLHCVRISELNVSDGETAVYKDGERVKAMGIITGVKKKVTKSDTTMAFVDLEDITSLSKNQQNKRRQTDKFFPFGFKEKSRHIAQRNCRRKNQPHRPCFTVKV